MFIFLVQSHVQKQICSEILAIYSMLVSEQIRVAMELRAASHYGHPSREAMGLKWAENSQ
jgi:hypothetical protein